MRKHLPYPYQYLWSSLFLVLFPLSLYFTVESKSLIFSWNLCTLGALSWELPILLDTMSLLFSSTVMFISAAIFTFGETYMRNEKATNPRFWALVVVFVVSMLTVIFIPSLLLMMLGWDGLGMSSFLLIMHYQNTSSLYGSYITVLSNRIGDAMLLMVVALFGSNGHCMLWMLEVPTTPSHSIIEQMLSMDYFLITFFCMAAYSKSAQLPFNAWLPEAMAAPTPVSALVHSSTLVTAGIYIMIRSFDFWSSWPLVSLSVWLTGMGTMMAGSGKATIEGDVKKTVAYSTMSQLGFMVTILGLGFPTIAFYHLITHALFKATMFMSVGTIFSYSHHYQSYDNWKAKWYLPMAASGLGISLGAMNIFPFLAGMYSKEMIMNTQCSQFLLGSWNYTLSLVGMSVFLASTFTMVYTVRIWRGLIYTKYTARAYYTIEKPAIRPELYARDNNMNLRAPFGALIMGTITGGSVVGWIMIMPTDMAPMPTIIKMLAILPLGVGMLNAFLPCRGVTKYRSNQNVFGKINKRSSVNMYSLVNKANMKNYPSSFKSKLHCASVLGDWGHKHDGLHLFMERKLAPFYRVFFLSSKMINLLEQGMLNIWSSMTPTMSAKEMSNWSKSFLNRIDTMVGISVLVIIHLVVCF